MREFLAEYDFVLNIGIELLAALVGLLMYNKFKSTKVKYFIWFLWYVVFIDLIGWMPYFSYKYESFNWINDYTKGTLFYRSYFWYTLFWSIGSALFVSLYFRSIIEDEYFKKVIKLSTYLFIILCVIYLPVNYSVYYNGESYLIKFSGVLLTVLSTSLYLAEVLMSHKIINFYKSVHFYVASVFFIFFLIKTPITLYESYYTLEDGDYVFLRDVIILLCNMFMYITFIFSLVFCKPQKVDT